MFSLITVRLPWLSCLLSSTVLGATLLVPEDHATIQAAIDAAQPGDEIWVAAGTYRPSSAGQSDARQATFHLVPGISVLGGFDGVGTLRDQRDPVANPTILSGDLAGDDTGPLDDPSSGENAYHVVTARNVEDVVLDGLVIRAGRNGTIELNRTSDSPFYMATGQGAGMYSMNSGVTIRNCVFTANRVLGYGGGVYNEDSRVRLENCTFYNNEVAAYEHEITTGGGGMANVDSIVTLVNCVFVRNSGAHSGGGLYNWRSNVFLVNCTLMGNSGGGIFNKGGPLTVTNSILWTDEETGLSETAQIRSTSYESTDISVSFSCIQGGWSAGGTGNLSQDPLFVDSTAGDLHLAAQSPCIDAGSNAAPDLPATDRDGRARIVNATVDMGAYEWSPPDDANSKPGSDANPICSFWPLCGFGAAQGLVLTLAALPLLGYRSRRLPF